MSNERKLRGKFRRLLTPHADAAKAQLAILKHEVESVMNNGLANYLHIARLVR